MITYRSKFGRLAWLPVLVISGCRGKEVTPFPVWAARPLPYAPTIGSRNAFDDYVIAAKMVEDAAGDHLNRVSFYPKQQKEAIELAAKGVAKVKAAVSKDCEFHFTPREPLEKPPYQRGWRLIGRCLVWDIQRFAAAGAYPSAIRNAIIATKFGFDLTGGSATDASLGLSIVDEARQALVPYVPKMQSSELEALAIGLRNDLDRKPALRTTFRNEAANMAMAVQYLQDCYQKDDFNELLKANGELKDLVQYIRDLKRDDSTKRPAFFRDLSAESRSQISELQLMATAPTRDRAGEYRRDKRGRPWHRFAQYYFTAGRPLLAINDACLARTRLWLIDCELMRAAKLYKAVPKTLDNFPRPLVVDPYSGLRFRYHAEGMEYLLYSVGGNFVDDGGATDDAFNAPDLRLERN